MRFPLRVRCFIGISGEPSAYIISDDAGRSINICCEVQPVRREVAKLWTPEEAEALAKKIARFLTDEHAIDISVAENIEGRGKPKPAGRGG